MNNEDDKKQKRQPLKKSLELYDVFLQCCKKGYNGAVSDVTAKFHKVNAADTLITYNDFEPLRKTIEQDNKIGTILLWEMLSN